MNVNMQRSGSKNKLSRRETLPLLRGMFICPEPVRRLKNAAGHELLRGLLTQRDPSPYEFACE